MQAMAPGLRSEPQAGHFVGGPVGRCGAVGAEGLGVDAEGAPPPEGCGTGPGGGPLGAPTGTPAPTGCGAGIGKTVWHLGQRTCLPTEPSGTDSGTEHFGQPIICGMTILTIFDFQFSIFDLQNNCDRPYLLHALQSQ